MNIRHKGPEDFRRLENATGVRFFNDAGRTAIASTLQTAEAKTLARRNPMRSWAFGRVTCLAAEQQSPEGQHELDALRKRMQLLNNLEEYIVNHEAGLSGSRLTRRQHDVFHRIATFTRGEMDGGVSDLTQAGYIEMPTGTGKTVIFSELLKAFHSQGEDKRPLLPN
jgi:Type III restriction enzyme, res subunit